MRVRKVHLPVPSLPPLLTGSRVYGLPDDDSDIDLVVMVNSYTHDLLARFADQSNEKDPDYDRFGSRSLRYGKLNLICIFNPVEYEVWRKGTKALQRQAPVSRAYACRFFDKLRLEANLLQKGDPAPRKPKHPPLDDMELPF